VLIPDGLYAAMIGSTLPLASYKVTSASDTDVAVLVRTLVKTSSYKSCVGGGGGGVGGCGGIGGSEGGT